MQSYNTAFLASVFFHLVYLLSHWVESCTGRSRLEARDTNKHCHAQNSPRTKHYPGRHGSSAETEKSLHSEWKYELMHKWINLDLNLRIFLSFLKNKKIKTQNIFSFPQFEICFSNDIIFKELPRLGELQGLLKWGHRDVCTDPPPGITTSSWEAAPREPRLQLKSHLRQDSSSYDRHMKRCKGPANSPSLLSVIKLLLSDLQDLGLPFVTPENNGSDF